jgi:sodium transport system permease protein
MSGLSTVYKKEVSENLRDRRSLFSSVLLGPILFPILFIGLAYFAGSKQQESAEKILEVPVVGTQHAPNLIRFLEQQGVVIQTAPDDPEAAVRSQDMQVIVRIPEQFAEQWSSGKPAVIEVIADPSRRESNTPMRRVRGLLNAYGAQIGQLRLQLRGVSPTLSAPIMIKDVDLSTPQSRGMLVMIMLPYVLMITAFTGGMHLAIDSTAGEKERKSLEPLLISPVPRWQIMLGKMLATATYAFASLVLTLLAFRFAFPLLPTGALGVDLNLSTQAIGGILLTITPVVVLAAAMLTTLAAVAKSLREAQSYMGLVFMIPMIPSLIFMVNPMKPETWMMAIPMFSQNMLIGEFVRGEPVNLLWLSLSMGCTLLIGFAFAAIAANLFNRPRIVFSN